MMKSFLLLIIIIIIMNDWKDCQEYLAVDGGPFLPNVTLRYLNKYQVFE